MVAKRYDVLIIGGGPAGLAVATSLARQLHTALVLDSGVYRNARATHMHAVPGWDHVNPAEFRAKAKADVLKRYSCIEFKSATVKNIQKLVNGHFQATDEQGTSYTGRKVALATGVKDIMPAIEGYSDCYAHGIFHCLFCHGYEERGAESAGVLAIDWIASPMMAMHLGNMALQLSKKLNIYTNGNEKLVDEITASMKKPRSRITFETRKIKKLALASPDKSDVIVTLEDGTQLKEGFLAHHPLVELQGPFVQQLGLELGPQGEIKTTPPFNETTVPGIFAAGDAATIMRAVPNAISMGGLAAAGLVSQLQAELALEED